MREYPNWDLKAYRAVERTGEALDCGCGPVVARARLNTTEKVRRMLPSLGDFLDDLVNGVLLGLGE